MTTRLTSFRHANDSFVTCFVPVSTRFQRGFRTFATPFRTFIFSHFFGQLTGREALMARTLEFNRHQYRFLRNLRLHPDGLPRRLWPRASTLVRWMAEESFRHRIELEFVPHALFGRLSRSTASANAMQQLSATLARGDLSQIDPLLRVIRKSEEPSVPQRTLSAMHDRVKAASR